MCFVDEDTRALGFGDVDELFEVPEVAIHRVNSFDHDEQTLSLVANQRRFQRGGIIMLEFFRSAARESRAIAQTDVRAVVEHSDIGFAKQAGDDAEGTAESAVKEHGIFPAEKLRELALELAVRSVMPESIGEPQAPSPWEVRAS